MPVRRLIAVLLPLVLLAWLAAWLLRRDAGSPAPAVSAAPPPPPAAAPQRLLDYRPVEISLPPAPAPRVALPQPADGAIPGEYTIAFRDKAALQAFLDTAAGRGLRILGVIPALLAVRVGGDGASLQDLLGEGVTVDNNYRVQVPALPDLEFWQGASPMLPLQDGLLEFLGIPDGPERLGWGEGVTIALLDTGWLGHAAVAEGTVRLIDLLESLPVGEFSGHGTAVAGLLASTDPLAPGIAPGSELLAVRVLDGEGRGDAFTLAKGILTAVANGADIINMSLGSYNDSQVLRMAVDYAAAQGVLLVAASGNDGAGQPTYPAAYANVLAVAAVDANGNRAPFSNYGDAIDIAAPGYQVNALWADDGFVYFDGTSASAPLVAGMAARVLQLGLAGDAAGARAVLLAAANETGPPGDDIQYGAGLLNAPRIESAGQPGIRDIALADIYPAVEESDGFQFPVYVTVENRGTEPLATVTARLLVDGAPSVYSFSGLLPGAVESIRIPVVESQLTADRPVTIEAAVQLSARAQDARAGNDRARLVISRKNP